MIIFLRALPFLIPLLEVGIFVSQIRHPLLYPWITLIGVLILPIASLAIGRGRLPVRELIEKMAPSFLLMATLAFALLLTEGMVPVVILVTIAALSSFISLELLFVLLYNPVRYPVNGLSRVNVAYVPIVLWYGASTWSGLMVFLHLDRGWYAVFLAGISAILFRTTAHVGARPDEQSVWTGLGALIGLHVGLLGVLLPLGMQAQGFVAALLISAALRCRRYIYDPKPSVRQAWVEAVCAVIGFAIVLSTAKWL